MKNEKFDQLLSTIRNEHVDDKVVASAGERVWSALNRDTTAPQTSSHMLRACQDFQALIPAYLRKELAAGRSMLLEDHVHSCVACRHALEQTRTVTAAPRPERKALSLPGWRWAMGAAAVAAMVFVAIGFR